MKIIAKTVEMVARFDRFGNPNPIRFRVDTEEFEQVTIKIDRIIQRAKENIGSNQIMVFICQSCINGLEKTYELKYEISTCKWILYKM